MGVAGWGHSLLVLLTAAGKHVIRLPHGCRHAPHGHSRSVRMVVWSLPPLEPGPTDWGVGTASGGSRVAGPGGGGGGGGGEGGVVRSYVGFVITHYMSLRTFC